MKTNAQTTAGALTEKVAACKTKEEAQALVEHQIELLCRESPELIHEQARTHVMLSIGYQAGYFDREEAYRILELFNTRHPYLGGVGDWPKTAEETIALGYAVGRQGRR